VAEGLLNEESAATIMRVLESERGMSRTINDGAVSDDEESGPAAPAHVSMRMTKEELKVELDRRTALLREGAVEGLDTDQWRVFCHIIEVLTSGERYLRLLVQASAGTGKSFLLSTVACIHITIVDCLCAMQLAIIVSSFRRSSFTASSTTSRRKPLHRRGM